jgi:Tol biopolymer transport system component
MRGRQGRRTIGWPVAMTCLVASLVLPAVASAAFPGANGRIAFAQALAFGQYDIYSVQPNGGGLTQLTSHPSTELAPSWSAAGRRITYLRNVHGRYQVYVMNADGTNQTRVSVDPTTDSSPGFSPSGGRITYSKDNLPFADASHPRRISVVTVRRDGSDPRLVATGYVRHPEYSPDGTWIAFDGTPVGTTPRTAIWLAHPNGSDLHRITAPGQGGYDEFPDWSPSGNRLMFSRCDGSLDGCFGYVYSVRADGSGLRKVAYNSLNERVVYSPDGHRLASVAGDPGGSEKCLDIYTFSLAHTNGRYVTHNCETDPNSGDFASWPSWQPLPNG